MNNRTFLLTKSFLCLLACALLPIVANGQVDKGRITDSYTEPIEKSVAASAESGIVAIAHVKEGDRVRIGDPLASINHNVLKETLAIAIARSESTTRLETATLQLKLIESQLEAVNSLQAGGHTSQHEIALKKTEHQQAIAELRASEEELRLAALEVERIKAQIQDRIVKSPIDGIVTEIHKQPGENVSNNEPQYATIVRVDQLKVRFYLDANTLKNTKPGDRVSLAIGPEKFSTFGTVRFVFPVIDPDSGLGRLDVVIENSSGSIQSGIACYWQAKAVTAQEPTTQTR